MLSPFFQNLSPPLSPLR